MDHKLFRGVATALVTPFRLDFIHEEAYDRLLQRQVEAGAAAVVVCGTTGESATLTDGEKLELIRRTADTVRERCLVIAGTGSNDTAHAIALSRAAEAQGADALLVVTPYYNKATPRGLREHYLALAEQVHIPIILYNVPSRTGVDIPVEVYRDLAAHPNICGVKEASGSMGKIARIKAACPADFGVWAGNDDQIVPVAALGGDGVVSVLANVCPEETVEMTQLALRGELARAGELQCRYMALIDGLFREVNPIPVKAAMNLMGLQAGRCRLPLTEPEPETTEALRALLARYGLADGGLIPNSTKKQKNEN